MASISKVNNSKGFTAAEAAVSIFIFAIAITAGIISYINLLKTNLVAQGLYASVENLSLGFEKIWREIKYGSNFKFNPQNPSTILFKDINCAQIEIQLRNGVIKYIKNGAESDLNNLSLAAVKNLNFYIPMDATSITVSLLAFTKSTKFDIPINLQMTAAPINAPFPVKSCE